METGTRGKGVKEVKYGDSFPVIGEEGRITCHLGSFIIRYTEVGTPEWTTKYSVLIPTKFEVVETIRLSNKGKAVTSGFKVIH